MEIAIGIAAVVAVLALYVFVRSRGRAKPLEKEIPKIEDLNAELSRLRAALAEAEKGEDRAVVNEIQLQMRVQEHWLRKFESGDDNWREYYEKSSGNLLDEWGKSGSR